MRIDRDLLGWDVFFAMAGDSVLAGQDFAAAGLVQVDDAWETSAFDTAATRNELRTEANAATFRLDPPEGCP